MTKIMLVEDDNNLREIYEARLVAEGYDIVSAQDGEAALALAAKERPDLIITDVMMPKISGFEMLDILRNTENLRDVKVIMLTALGQAEDNARAGALGADRYLVKSQVTLEDIVKATHEVIEGDAAAASPASEAAPEAEISAAVIPEPALAPEPVAVEATPDIAVSQPAPVDVVLPPADTPPEAPVEATEPTDTPTEEPDAADNNDAGSPANQAAAEAEVANAIPVAEEESQIRAQIDDFLNTSGSTPAPQAAPESVSEPAVEADSSAVLPEEPDTEYDKDASSPDMGQLSVQPAPAAVANPAITDSPAPVTPQSSSDKVVSDAIDDMVASTSPQPAAPTGTALVDPLTPQNPLLPSVPPASAAEPVEPTPSDSGSTHKLVISPLNTPSRPDINQLLSMEEAKTAAAQAAAATQPVAPAWQPNTATPNQGPNQNIDPNSISL